MNAARPHAEDAARLPTPGHAVKEAPGLPDAEQLPRPSSLSAVKGWFDTVDQVLFDWLLTRQRRLDHRGDLLELGCYLGKSAAFLGTYLRPGETFTVCDLFDSPAPDDDNRGEMRRSYSTLTRRAFEANYLAFHDELPRLVQAPTSALRGRVEPASCRFVHVDASHLYEHVHGDIQTARQSLTPDGVVALDDYRAEHTPGVAAATWQAVLLGELRPICISGRKFYGTWGDPGPVQEELLAWAVTLPGLWHEVQTVAGHRIVRVSGKKLAPPPQPRSRYPAPVSAEAESGPPVAPTAAARAGATARMRSRMRRIAVDVLPPIVSRRIAAYLRAR